MHFKPTMRITHLAAVAASVSSLYAGSASAQTVRFREQWDGGSANWRTTSYATVPTNVDSGTTSGNPVSTLSEPSTCAGNFARETPANKGSGGRVFQVPAAAATQTVAVGNTLCLAAWIRNGALGGKAYMGINYVQSAVGYTDTRYGAGGPGVGVFRDSTYREHWLIGTEDIGAAGDRPWGTPNAAQNAYGSLTVIDATPGTWKLYKKQWTVTATDLASFNADPGANAFVLKFENFGGNSDNTLTPPDNADFGDLFVFDGVCPSDDAIAALSSVHTPCAAGSTAPFCVASGTAPALRYRCEGCDASFGATGTKVCASTSPICTTAGASAGTCAKCDKDLGATLGTSACASASAPYCVTKPGATDLGSCGKCSMDADCILASGGPNHAGLKCDTASGACTTGCSADSDCTAGNWCDGGSNTTAGICKPKLDNGVAIPASQGGLCTATTGARLCLSGVCDSLDNACGLSNKQPCALASTCRANVCEAGTCGKLDDQPCTSPGECKSAVCAGGKCSAKCTSDTECGGVASGIVCDNQACVEGCRGTNGNGCPASEVCSSTSNAVGQCDSSPSDAGAVLSAGGGLAGGGQNCSVGGPGSSSAAGLLLVAFGAFLGRRRRS